MAINFSDKILITNPTIYYLGQGVACIGIIPIAFGVITFFTGDVLLPALTWFVLGMPFAVVGTIFMACGLTKR